MQDAVPLTLGQEFSGYVGMLDDDMEWLEGLWRGFTSWLSVERRLAPV